MAALGWIAFDLLEGACLVFGSMERTLALAAGNVCGVVAGNLARRAWKGPREDAGDSHFAVTAVVASIGISRSLMRVMDVEDEDTVVQFGAGFTTGFVLTMIGGLLSID